MKKILLLALGVIMLSSSGNIGVSNAAETQADSLFTGDGIFPKGEKNEAYAKYFRFIR